MSSANKYEMVQGETYYMISGVPYRLITTTTSNDEGFTMTTKLVPAPVKKQKGQL